MDPYVDAGAVAEASATIGCLAAPGLGAVVCRNMADAQTDVRVPQRGTDAS